MIVTDIHYIYKPFIAGLQALLARARKLPKATPEFRADLDAFEERLSTAAAERREEVRN